ncbi:hypothetical protein WNY59_02345 [Ahrensia kielensis]|uniref:Arylmalonate decarboxylase n=1 Tax=Ahrensia kielensis TaxID=76980 RepID=A0ABU9T3K5_9HYPH
MTDILGHRLKIGTLVPSTNSSVEPEYARMLIDGVTHMSARIAVPNVSFRGDDDVREIVEGTQPDLLPSLARVRACNPDRIIMGMAVPCFWGGRAGCDAMRTKLEENAGVPVTLPPDAIAQALAALGVRRIGVVSPYLPLADKHVEQWFAESGIDVAAIYGLRAKTEDSVIDITPEQLRDGFDRVDDDSVEALVHVGTSIAMARLVEDFETQYSKPVVSVNVANLWATLRNAGLNDQINGYGRLMSDH